MHQAWIETRLILRQLDILPPNYHPSRHKRRNFLRTHLYIRLSATGVLKPWKELCIFVYVVADNSSLEGSTHGEEHIYCHPQWSRADSMEFLTLSSYHPLLRAQILSTASSVRTETMYVKPCWSANTDASKYWSP